MVVLKERRFLSGLRCDSQLANSPRWGRPDDGDKIKYYHYHAYAMLGFNKLAGNARRFKMLIGMSLQEFDLLLVKVEKMYPEERERGSPSDSDSARSGQAADSRWVCGIGRCCSCSTALVDFDD